MAYVWVDRVLETSTTTGTGAFTLAGAVDKHVTFASVCSVADTLPYVIIHLSANEWEVGLGTYSGANTLTRTTVQASSNAGAAVNFSAGTKRVGLSNTAASLVPSTGGTFTGQTIIDLGSGAVPGTLPTNGTPYLWLKAANGAGPGRALLDGFGGHLGYSARRANGTRAAPTALQSGDSIGFMNGFGYGATDYSLNGRVTVDMQASENWTDTAQGTKIVFKTTPNTTATEATAAEIGQDKGFTSYGAINTVYTGTVNCILGNSIANSEAISAVTASFQMHGTSANPPGFAQIRWDASAAGSAPTSFFARSRGTTLNSRAVVNSGDRVGQILFSADDGTNFVSAAAIRAEVDGTPGTTDMPGRITFLTSPDGSATLSEKMRINNSGDLQMGGANTVIDSSRHHQLRAYTVATLPAAGTAGRTAYVTDATAPTFLGVLVGGGAVVCPVFDNGVAWVSA